MFPEWAKGNSFQHKIADSPATLARPNRTCPPFALMKAADYLLKRIDRPLEWVKVFGDCLLAAGASVGHSQNGLKGAFEFGVMGFIAGVLSGLLLGGIAWLTCRLIRLDRPVRRPDLWALHLRCTCCEYETTPDGPWRVRDCMVWPEQCPSCAGQLVLVHPTCPRCHAGGLSGTSELGDVLSQVRWPRNRTQALWGGSTCKQCNCVYDKWGREVVRPEETGISPFT